MKLKVEEFKKIQRALSSAYRADGTNEVGDAWKNRVMVRIRGLGPSVPQPSFMALFERHVWRLAPAAALMLLVLGGLLYQQLDFLSDCEMARVFMGTSWDNSFFQILGAS